MVVIRIGVLPWCKVFGWEKGSETSLEHIRASANCVRGVAVVGALAYNKMIIIMIITITTVIIIIIIRSSRSTCRGSRGCPLAR